MAIARARMTQEREKASGRRELPLLLCPWYVLIERAEAPAGFEPASFPLPKERLNQLGYGAM